MRRSQIPNPGNNASMEQPGTSAVESTESMDTDFDNQEGEDNVPEKFIDQKPNERRMLRKLYSLHGSKFGDEMSLEAAIKLQNKSNQMFERVSTAREALMDAALTKKTMDIIKNAANELQTGARTFVVEEFVETIGTSLFGKSRPEKDQPFAITNNNWIKFGNLASNYLMEPPTFTFLNGAFDPGEARPKERKERKATEKRKETVAVVPKNITEKGSEDKLEVHEYEELYEAISNHYTKYRRPIGYYPCILDPHNFAHTIQNMFAISCLVKDAKVRQKLLDGLPVLIPEDKYQEENPQSHSDRKEAEKTSQAKQCIISMNMDHWEEMVEAFNVREPFYKRKKRSS